MEKNRLINRDLDILNIMWNAGHPLLASAIQKEKPEFNINTVHASLRKLTALDIVRVVDIVQTGTAFGRVFEPTMTCDQLIIAEFKKMFPQTERRRKALLTALVEDYSGSDDALSELETLVKAYREDSKNSSI